MPYDVFLSHSSTDKPVVRAVCDWLKAHGVQNPWLDDLEIEPGDRLPNALGKAIEDSRSAVVFIGPNGEGPWQGEEVDSLLNKAIALSRQKDEFRIIPVLLPNADTSKLRWFLKTRLWVDLSKGVTDSSAELYRLRQAILGKVEDDAVPDDPEFNPYRGLLAFRFEDANFFFGRVQECRSLATILGEWRLACIVGPSGNGKSSLARAGLGSDAAEKALPGIRSMTRVTLVPGSDLLRAWVEQLGARLSDSERADKIAAAIERIDPKAEQSSPKQWAERLNNEIRAWFPDPDQRVLFLIDQFEEIFTHRGMVSATDAEREDRTLRVLDCLALLLESGEKRWHFVLTLRSDFYQRCRISAAFWELVSAKHAVVHLDELNEDGWREAVKGPAARAGAYLEAGLVETMLRDVYRQRGSMPLLQLALHQLWRLRQGACLTHAAYTTLGGVANALQNRAESVLDHLSQQKPELLDIARNLFLRLTALGEGVSDSRRRLDRAELDWERTDPRDIEHVLAELSNADNRLLLADAASVEVTHEVLIRDCDAIRAWIEASRKEIPYLRRLTHAARRWQDNERHSVFLNAVDTPRELKQWSATTSLRLTRLEREYLQASRKQRAADYHEKRRQRHALLRSEMEKREQAEKSKRNAFVLSAVAVLLALATTIAGFVAWRGKVEAVAATEASQDALLKSFVRTIGVSGTRTPDEREALWELATLDPANRNVRTKLVNQWLQSSDLGVVQRATAREGMASHAAIGLDTTLEAELALNVRAAGDRWANALDSLEGRDFSSVLTKVDTLSGLTALMQREDAAPFAARGAQALLWALETPPQSMGGDPNRALQLAEEVLSAFAARIKPQDAARLAGPLVSAVGNPGDHAPWRLYRLRYMLPVLARVIRPEDATLLAETLVKALETPQERDPFRVHVLAQALSSLTERMKPEDAAPLSARGTLVLVEALENRQEPYPGHLLSLGQALVALVARMKPEDAAPLAARGALALLNALENIQKDDRYLSSLAGALSALATRMNREDATPLAGQLVYALENAQVRDYTRLSALAEALSAVAARMKPEDAVAFAARGARGLLKPLDNLHEIDLQHLPPLGLGLSALAARMTPEDVAPLAQPLATALENSKYLDFSRQRILAEALSALAERMKSEDATLLAQPLAKALENSKDIDMSRQLILAKALSALAARMTSEDAAPLAARGARGFLRALESSKESELSHLSHGAKALSDLAKLMNREDAAPLAARCAEFVLVTLHQRDPDQLLDMAQALIALAEHIPEARITRIFALSYIFFSANDSPQGSSLLGHPAARSSRSDYLGLGVLDTKSLTEMLKWPSAVGVTRKILLAELERRAQPELTFDDDLWSFVRQAGKLGISPEFLRTPPKRPNIQDALAELRRLQAH